MKNNKFNEFIHKLYTPVDKFWELVNIFINRIPEYKIDLNSTDLILLPFYIDEMSCNDFRDILIDYTYTEKHVYIFDYKAELIYYTVFITNKELELQSNNKKLLLQERDSIISKFRDNMLNRIRRSPLSNYSRFYMHISAKDIRKDIKNKSI